MMLAHMHFGHFHGGGLVVFLIFIVALLVVAGIPRREK